MLKTDRAYTTHISKWDLDEAHMGPI